MLVNLRNSSGVWIRPEAPEIAALDPWQLPEGWTPARDSRGAAVAIDPEGKPYGIKRDYVPTGNWKSQEVWTPGNKLPGRWIEAETRYYA